MDKAKKDKWYYRALAFVRFEGIKSPLPAPTDSMDRDAWLDHAAVEARAQQLRDARAARCRIGGAA